MEKKITTRQACLLVVLSTIALKLSTLPAIMSDYASSNAYMICLVAIIFDFIGTLIILKVMEKVPEKNFYELIKNTLSKSVAVVIYFFLALYFFIKSAAALFQLHNYYSSALFNELNHSFGLIIILFLSLFLLSKNFRTHGRLMEVCFWPITIAVTLTLLFPVNSIKLTNLFPLFEDGVYPIWNGFIHTSFAFGDYVVLFILMGKINYQKNTTKKILFYTLNVLFFIFQFYIVFIGVYGHTAVNQTLALSELPLHNSFSVTVSKLEWLTIIVWTALLFIYANFMNKCCCECLDNIFGVSAKKCNSIVLSIITVVLQVFTTFEVFPFARIYTNLPMSIATKVFPVGLIILLILCYIIHKKKGSKGMGIYTQNNTTKTRRRVYGETAKNAISK